MNQGRVNVALLPHEKKIVRPYNLPPLPLKSVNEMKEFNKFLENSVNLSATVSAVQKNIF